MKLRLHKSGALIPGHVEEREKNASAEVQADINFLFEIHYRPFETLTSEDETATLVSLCMKLTYLNQFT
jgi:hypothetical protein